MPRSLGHRPHPLVRRPRLRALMPALVVAGGAALAACGSSGLPLTPDSAPDHASNHAFLDPPGIINLTPPTPTPSADGLAVQAYRAIVEHDRQLVIADAYKVPAACTFVSAGDASCQDSVVTLKHMAQTMLADLKGVHVPASIAKADGEYRNGLQTFITAADEVLTYVATGSGDAHQRALAHADAAERELNAADAALWTAI